MALLPSSRIDRDFAPTLGNFFSDWFEDPWIFPANRFPAVDVKESENAYIVKADLPGYDKDNIEVSLHDGVLSIKATTDTTEEVKREGYLRKERRTGTFCRSFAFPGTIDEDNIKADFKNGVLTVELPKSSPSKGRRIDIQ